MIRTILGMGGKSLSKELLDAKLTISNSAFVQRRYQIKPEAFSALFKEFTAPILHSTPIFQYSRQMEVIALFLEIPWIQKSLSKPNMKVTILWHILMAHFQEKGWRYIVD